MAVFRWRRDESNQSRAWQTKWRPGGPIGEFSPHRQDFRIFINTDKMRKCGRGFIQRFPVRAADTDTQLPGLNWVVACSQEDLMRKILRCQSQQSNIGIGSRKVNGTQEDGDSLTRGRRVLSLVRRSTDGSDWADSQVCLLVACSNWHELLDEARSGPACTAHCSVTAQG